ncbi:hypothetical protein MKX54_10955 [Alkalihalobacillus sp. FSL R5-0424]
MVYSTLDLEISYEGVMYKVVEQLASDYSLVVKKEDMEAGKFPIQTYIIPAKY